MKSILTIASILVLASPAFAKGYDYFSYSEFSDQMDCAKVANLLTQISSDDLNVKVTQNCKFHKHTSEGVHLIQAVGVGVGTWGVATVDCAITHTGLGCERDQDHFQLEATLKNLKKGKISNGQSLAMSPEDCDYYSKVMNKVSFYRKSARLEASCLQGAFTVSLVPRSH